MGLNRPSSVGQNNVTGASGRGVSGTWTTDRGFWREHYASRPYAKADRRFEDFEPGYRYAYEMEPRHHGRTWTDAENDLRTGYDAWEGRENSTWDNVKDAVKDAWDKLTGRDHDHPSSTR